MPNLKKKACCGKTSGGCGHAGNCCYSPGATLFGRIVLYHTYHSDPFCADLTREIALTLEARLTQSDPGVWQMDQVTILEALDNGVDFKADLDLQGDAGQGGLPSSLVIQRTGDDRWLINLLLRRRNVPYNYSYLWNFGGYMHGGHTPTAPYVSGSQGSSTLDGPCCGIAAPAGSDFECFSNGNLLWSVNGHESVDFRIFGNTCCHDAATDSCLEKAADQCPSQVATAQCPGPCLTCAGNQTVSLELSAAGSGVDCNCVGDHITGTYTLTHYAGTAFGANNGGSVNGCYWQAIWTFDYPEGGGGGYTYIIEYNPETNLWRTLLGGNSTRCTAVFDSGWVAGLFTCVTGHLVGTTGMSAYSRWPVAPENLCLLVVTA